MKAILGYLHETLPQKQKPAGNDGQWVGEQALADLVLAKALAKALLVVSELMATGRVGVIFLSFLCSCQ